MLHAVDDIKVTGIAACHDVIEARLGPLPNRVGDKRARDPRRHTPQKLAAPDVVNFSGKECRQLTALEERCKPLAGEWDARENVGLRRAQRDGGGNTRKQTARGEPLEDADKARSQIWR